jgi:hypothetical protein
MKPTVIVWDLETVPDIGGFAAAHDLVGKSDVEVREAIGDKFPKHIYHSIVCIGALIAHWELDHWAVDAVGAPHVGERNEKELISAFCDKIAELRPRIVLDGAQPARVPDDVIAEIRARERNGLVQLPKREMFHVGDQVRILQGPFAGCLYAGMRAHERVLVLLALLGGQQRVEVPKADVEAVSNTGRAE